VLFVLSDARAEDRFRAPESGCRDSTLVPKAFPTLVGSERRVVNGKLQRRHGLKELQLIE
jgi:hypothetical protein